MSTIWSGGMEIFILNTYLEGKLALQRQLSVGDHDSHNLNSQLRNQKIIFWRVPSY